MDKHAGMITILLKAKKYISERNVSIADWTDGEVTHHVESTNSHLMNSHLLFSSAMLLIDSKLISFHISL